MKQCEVVAIVKDRKERAKVSTTEAYHLAQKADLFSGLLRTYRPFADEGRKLPAEAKQIQATVPRLLDKTQRPVVELFDTVLTQDAGNCDAVADVLAELDGRSIGLKGVPATHLLFLEKQLGDLLTMARAMPILDPSEKWTADPATGQFRSEIARKTRSEKTQRPLVMYPATVEHPAQTQLVTEDVAVGEWEETKFSGAVTQDRKDGIVRRIIALQEAVVRAREQANQTPVNERKEGDEIWRFIFGE